MSAHTAIHCDICGEGVQWRTMSGQASHGTDRRILAEEGWHTVRKTGELVRDICPTCWERGYR